MLDQCLAGARAGALHDVQHTRGKAGLNRKCAESRRRARRDFRGFRNDRIAGRECRRDLPGEQIQRQVPRRDAGDHAERLAQGVVQRACVGRMRVARPLRDRRGEEAQVHDRARNVERACELDRLAGVARFELGEFFEIAFDQIGEAIQHLRAFLGGRRGPVRKRAPRGNDGGIDVGAIGIRTAREDRASRGFVDIEIGACLRGLQSAADQVGKIGHGRSLAASLHL